MNEENTVNSDAQCSNCFYSCEYEEELLCKRKPPMLIVSQEIFSIFPAVFNENWCGEWRKDRPKELK